MGTSGDDTPASGPEKVLAAKITVADIRRFLKERTGGDVACPMCRTSDWRTLHKQGYDSVLLPVMDEFGDPDAENVVPLLALFCGNCAFMFTVSRNQVEFWLASKAEGNANG